MSLKLIRVTSHNLALKYPFTLGNGSSRTHTPVSFIEIDYHGFRGIGEAAMPPYLGESPETFWAFVKKIDWTAFSYPFNMADIIPQIEAIAPGNTAAKAAVDMALFDLKGKLDYCPSSEFFHTTGLKRATASYTLGICTPEELNQKMQEQAGFKRFKLKLGSAFDKENIALLRKLSKDSLCADANQAWKSKEQALDMIHYLHDHGYDWIEQAMPTHMNQEQEWLFERSPLPIIADESCQRIADLDQMASKFHGINIKLMKCGGLYHAQQMIQKAKTMNLKIVLGCMTETSCATYAAQCLSPLVDYIDTDGPWLLAEQPFKTPVLKNGIIQSSPQPGFGLQVDPNFVDEKAKKYVLS